MNVEISQQSPTMEVPIKIPKRWSVCVLKGLGGGIGQAADTAMIQELRSAVGEHVRVRLGREATDEDVENVIKMALQSDESADIRALAHRAVRAGERAAIESSHFFEGLVITVASQFGVMLEVNYKDGFMRFGKPLINRDELPAFLADLAKRCPELRVSWRR